MNEEYYGVSIDKKYWSANSIPLSAYKEKGFEVQPSRRVGDFDVFYNDVKVAVLFKDIMDAAAFTAKGEHASTEKPKIQPRGQI